MCYFSSCCRFYIYFLHHILPLSNSIHLGKQTLQQYIYFSSSRFWVIVVLHLFLHMLWTPQYISLIFVLNNYLLMISADAVWWSQSESRSVMLDSLWPHGLHSPWNSPDQNTGVGSLSLFQGIFPTQGSSPGLPHCRWILYQLSHKGSPRILEWVAYPFSSGSLQPRNPTRVST